MYPVAPVRRTGASMPGLFVLRQDDAVDHVDDAVGRGDVGLHDVRALNGHAAIADAIVSVSPLTAFAELVLTTSAAMTFPATT